MAIIHAQADLVPSKLEVLQAWVPEQPWGADVSATVGAYRFDDPAGEVGVEIHLVQAGGRVLQVPVTYRGAPTGDDGLIAVMEHSVLGRRWCYDGCTDPVFLRTLAAAVLGGVPAALFELVTEDGPVVREPSVVVSSTGEAATVPDVTFVGYTNAEDKTVVDAGPLRIEVLRAVGDAPAVDGVASLVGTWSGQSVPALLATVH